MPEVIISDASCLITLDRINELNILQCCYEQITITKEVAQEYGLPLPIWINVKQVQNNDLRTFLELSVDKGEASAITLAIENKDCLVILDDLKARKLASSLNLKITGTLGVIVKAKQLNCISDVKPIIEKLRNADFRINEKIISEILTQVGE